MPTGGGTFTTQNKILPGAYINFVALGSVPKVGARGVAALPLELDWGPENRVFALEARCTALYDLCRREFGRVPGKNEYTQNPVRL